MKKALEGLSGVERVEWDLAHDLFRVTGPADAESLVAQVRALKYDARLLPPDTPFAPTEQRVHPVGPVPEAIRRALDRARAERKLVLVDCKTDT